MTKTITRPEDRDFGAPPLAVFVHTGPGHYIGSCAVVIARDEQEARELLKPAMEVSGLGNEEIEFQAFELEPQIVHFADGDY